MIPTTHMAREIAEIPAVATRFLDRNAATLADLGARLRALDPGLVVTVARGSSDHAATYLKYAVELTAGVPVASVGPSIASVYGRPLRLAGAACIGISQSGASPDILAMMQAARAAGALTLALTNTDDAPLTRAAEVCLPLSAGPESSVAATKTFAASVLAGLALVAHWQQDRALQEALTALPRTLQAALACDWSPLSDRLARAGSAYVLGRGPGFAIAAEAALKLKETCGLHAEPHSAAEVLHGPAAIVRQGFPVLAMAVDDAARAHVIATAARLAEQGADVFVTGAAVPGALTLPLPAPLHPLVDPLVAIVPFYAMVEGLSRRRGFDPDTPFRLQKITATT
jgi:glutamine---fructose-6-phosphate transaminase (isomerizing)